VTAIDRNHSSRRCAWLVLVLGLFVGLMFQGTRHLWDPDEGRYTDVAHEMVELDDWLVPRLNPERPHFTKPPMTYWAIATSFSVFGNNEWAARLPNALAFALTGLLVFGLAQRLRLETPVLAAGIWMTMWGPVIGANAVTTDTLLTLFETLAVFGFVASGILDPDPTPRRRGVRLMWLGFGLAFLTKGPPGLLPLAAIVTFVAWRRRGCLAKLFDPIGLVLFAVTGLAWYIALTWHSPDLLHYFLVHEVAGRVASGEHHRNAGWFGWLAVYPPAFLIGTLPWLGVAATVWWSRWRRGERATALDPAARRFLWLWFALPLGVFILAQSRLPFYVLPLFVPAALALAASLGDWSGTGSKAAVALALATVAAVSLKGVGALVHADGDAHRLATELRQQVDLATLDEIVFVDTPVRYGLKHYTGMTVEQVESYPGAIGPEGYVAAETLCQELATDERQLLIVPTRTLDEIRNRAASCPRTLERVGTLRRWTLLRAIPEPTPAG
jgi:4-amino-4-deoxy-L-arabinose transferase-like glycosyltransferase